MSLFTLQRSLEAAIFRGQYQIVLVGESLFLASIE
jgi:hypothetical protein